jgi:hypothetical protein
VPKSFAKGVAHIIEQSPAPSGAAPSTSTTATQSQLGANKNSQAGTSAGGAISASTSLMPSNITSKKLNTVTGSNAVRKAPVSQGELHVFLVVRRGDEHPVAQVKTHNITTDQFFFQLRMEYDRLRGWLRRCLSIWGYSHCDFYKVTQL